MVQFQKLTRNLFLTLHGQNLHRQQRQPSKFLMRYQQFARSCLLRGCGASFQDGATAGKVFLCAPLWGVQICDYSAACSAVHGLEKTHHAWCVFSKPCTKITLHCNHRSGHLKAEHTERLFLLRRHLGNWPRSKHEKRTAGSAWETWTVAAADGVRCGRVRWEMNFLLTFETAPFICKHPVFFYWNRSKRWTFTLASHEVILQNGGTAVRIVHLRTSWRPAVSFTPQHFTAINK